MNKLILLLCGLLSSQLGFALSGQAYMDRFHTYTTLSQNAPVQATPEFLEFISANTALSNKLRERWLYELAIQQNWASFSQYYHPSNDMNLVCYQQIAQYYLGARQEALNGAIALWLTGDSRPPSCNKLFNLFLKDDSFNPNLITQRLALALDKRNIKLANYLLTQYKTPRTAELQALNAVHQNPGAIRKLNPSELNGYFYLYGLKRLVALNMEEKVLEFWQQGVNKHLLNTAQQQEFLAHTALYKAMRNSKDAIKWFAKVQPQHYNETLIDWEIRLALKRKDWKKVSVLINNATNKNSPCWQYWLARSLEEQGKVAEARAIFEPLANSRQYYGFLASLRLQRAPSFENEVHTNNLDVLKPYQEITTKVTQLYQNKQDLQASRLLNDFISELPKAEASALVYWIDTKLQWHDKSVNLSNSDILNNQLTLRFPLAYKDSVKAYAKKYTVAPEFIYAIIRQESNFRQNATSSAGARGLMQVMPNTAKIVSQASKITYNNQNQLFVSEKNINIGVAYLKQLSRRFSDHPILIAAAYNAGPKQVVFWLREHPPKEIDVWIETLPWQETRNYLKNVMAFYVVYQYRLDQKPNLKNFMAPLG